MTRISPRAPTEQDLPDLVGTHRVNETKIALVLSGDIFELVVQPYGENTEHGLYLPEVVLSRLSIDKSNILSVSVNTP